MKSDFVALSYSITDPGDHSIIALLKSTFK